MKTPLTALELDVVLSVLDNALAGWDDCQRARAARRALLKLSEVEPQPAPSPWIPVSNPPESGQYVLTCRYNEPLRDGLGFIVWVGRYFGKLDWQSDSGIIASPTHWMPLPAPPEPQSKEGTEK